MRSRLSTAPDTAGMTDPVSGCRRYPVAAKQPLDSAPGVKQRFRHSLRFKLLTISLSLLVIPWAGYRFIQDMESILRRSQDETLLSSAALLAGRLQTEVFPAASVTDEGSRHPRPDTYVHQLSHQPQLDGYGEDWGRLRGSAVDYGPRSRTGFRLLMGAWRDHYYLLLEADDPVRNYSQGAEVVANQSDHLLLAFTDQEQRLRQYLIAPRAPGRVAARAIGSTGGLLQPEQRIQGYWQEIDGGYSLELRIPQYLVGDKLALSQYDKESGLVQATSDITQLESIGNLVVRSERLQALLRQANIPGSRIWLTDINGHVLASQGGLSPEPTASAGSAVTPWFVHRLFSLILRQQVRGSPPVVINDSSMSAEHLSAALAGGPHISYHRPPDEDSLVVSALYPVSSRGDTKGILVVEQSTAAILSLQNRALQQLLTITLAVMSVIGLVLLGYASLLTRRIRQLVRQVERAVTSDGRIIGQLEPSDKPDELGELGRGFSRVLSRLTGYNEYLEQMASRLAHELRTPIAVVKTSLENALEVGDGGSTKYLNRALEGTGRLDQLVTQLAEATRLEQSLDHIAKHPVDLRQLLAVNLELLSAAYPQERFELTAANAQTWVMAAPELITQALENLIRNAVDFRVPGSIIDVELVETGGHALVTVCNRGPLLPDGPDPFKSMVSVRREKSQAPHLGLGLYLVRLIAQFHQGEASAANRQDGSGVCVTFSLAAEST